MQVAPNSRSSIDPAPGHQERPSRRPQRAPFWDRTTLLIASASVLAVVAAGPLALIGLAAACATLWGRWRSGARQLGGRIDPACPELRGSRQRTRARALMWFAAGPALTAATLVVAPPQDARANAWATIAAGVGLGLLAVALGAGRRALLDTDRILATADGVRYRTGADAGAASWDEVTTLSVIDARTVQRTGGMGPALPAVSIAVRDRKAPLRIETWRFDHDAAAIVAWLEARRLAALDGGDIPELLRDLGDDRDVPRSDPSWPSAD